MQVTLKVIAGPHSGTVFQFDRHDTFLVGRSCHAHFQLPEKDRYFSRIHFMMEVNPPHCRLIDMGSHNGTYVNGQRILSGDLRDGDEIRAGHTTLRLTVQPDRHEQPDTLNHQPQASPRVGSETSLPDHVIRKELGRDRLGQCYLGHRRGDNTPVTIRTIAPSVRPLPHQLEDFLRIARFLLKLEHRHLVRLCDVGATADQLYFVSEHVAGVDAATLVQRGGPQPVARVVRWGAQVLQALKYAHALHFVHCDIKPANLIIARHNGRDVVRLADFGIARAYYSAPFSGLSLTGDILTGAAFLPPEVLLNYQEARPAADQYAVAATLYFLLAGTHALKLPDDLHRRFSSLLRQQVVPLRERRPEVPEALAAVIHKAMARAPAMRYRNVVEFRQALMQAT
jgi:eukaryotic-like serine/threonine-protein kinase